MDILDKVAKESDINSDHLIIFYSYLLARLDTKSAGQKYDYPYRAISYKETIKDMYNMGFKMSRENINKIMKVLDNNNLIAFEINLKRDQTFKILKPKTKDLTSEGEHL